jgi:chromosome partitioning protein
MEILSLQGLTQLLNTIKEVKRVLNKDLKICGIVACMYDVRRRLSNEVLDQIRKNIKEKVFKTYIRESVRIAESPSFGKSVLSYAPSSHGSKDYKALAKEFINERR